ncbi:MAG: hypothetical protein WBG73_23280 [Coleofasciculaceae cyanobacterium]
MSNGKYGDLIKQARKPENQKGDKPDNQINSQPEAKEVEQLITEHLDKLDVRLAEVEVNLCVKVPISLRRHWSAEAKRTGVTMTTVIVEALKAKFGEPD